jgi:hypothetical protein
MYLRIQESSFVAFSHGKSYESRSIRKELKVENSLTRERRIFSVLSEIETSLR